jgi:peptide/nickel transport system permease protein
MTGVALAVLRRLGLALLILWGVTSASWLMTALLPGDPVSVVLGPNASPAEVARARQLYGLDRSLPEQYVRFMGRLVHFGPALDDDPKTPPPEGHTSCGELSGLHIDLGTSVRYRKPVVELIALKLPFSLKLAMAALLVQLVLGIGLGTIAGVRRGRRTDEAVVLATSALSAAPTFVTGLVLQYVFAIRLGLLPLDGASAKTPGELSALVLPALTLGLYGTAVLTRLVRAELGDALREPYVRTARAKGATRARAALAHALPNALVPVAQLSVLELGALVGGALVTEKLFRWPGLGEMAVTAIQARDAQAVVGVTLVSAAAITAATLLADVVTLLLDPRLRRAASR